MTTCPVCAREVAIPFALNLDAWRWLICPHCGARLERKNPRYVTAIACLFLVIPALGRLLGHRYAFLVYAVLAGGVLVILVELLWTGLQVRKGRLEPEIRLNLEK